MKINCESVASRGYFLVCTLHLHSWKKAFKCLSVAFWKIYLWSSGYDLVPFWNGARTCVKFWRMAKPESRSEIFWSQLRSHKQFFFLLKMTCFQKKNFFDCSSPKRTHIFWITVRTRFYSGVHFYLKTMKIFRMFSYRYNFY